MSHEELLTPTYASRYFEKAIPKCRLPDEMMPAQVAYQLIHDELNLDGLAVFNLGSFNTTWMEPEAEQLIMESIGKNFIDRFEYPQTAEIHQRVVNILANLYHAPEHAQFAGTATIGSSEAIELGLLAHKWAWKARRKAAGKPDDHPNIVFSDAAHVCWDKFARYFDVEMRKVPLTADRLILDPQKAVAMVDENTICAGAILGTTYTGACEPVEELNELLLAVKAEKGWDIPIHVDAASGGFVLPFTEPDRRWDFRLAQVRSINVSGHKYGLVYPGVGWLIFKEEQDLPEELMFYVNYLGDTMPTYTLNFSRGAEMVLAQYYNLLRLGHEGYRRVMESCLHNADFLGRALEQTGHFTLVSTGELPVVVFTFTAHPSFTPFQLAAKLRERGWLLPAYKLPLHGAKQEITVMRVVVRETFSHDMAENLVRDLSTAYKVLDGSHVERIEPHTGLARKIVV